MKKIIAFIFVTTLLFGCSSSSEKTQEDELKDLERTYQDIIELAQSEVCTDASEWLTIAIGHKPCGGPAGYIAYHKSVNLNTLQSKIDEYTEAQRVYNLKWGLISDCAITPPPSGVECQDGAPVLLP